MVKRVTKLLCLGMALVMVTSISGLAQPLIPDFNVGPKVRGGIKVGGNVVNISGDPTLNGNGLEARNSFMVGGYLNIDIPVLPFEIQPELIYIQKGAGVEGTSGSLKLDYFEIPLLIKYPILKRAPGVKPSIFAGPYLGINARSDFDDGFISRVIDENIVDTEFGAVVGAEVLVKNIVIGVRYSAAFTDTFESNIPNTADARNMALSAFIGFKFF